jgi:dihydropteroate synthase
MGIVNVTPDSFYDGGRHTEPHSGIEHGLRLAEAGADILDVGGESTRPGAEKVSLQQELDRVIPVVEVLSRKTDLPVSVDTTKAEVARAAVDAGAHWVNDISAGLMDPEILKVVAREEVPYVAMHMRGTPETMQHDTEYDDLISEILEYFKERLDMFDVSGIRREKVILDPGIGFGKAPEDNYSILAGLSHFHSLGQPLLVGPSRKSFLKVIGVENVEDRLPGTIAVVTACALSGVEIVRVHDVAESLQAVLVASQLRQISGVIG